MNEEMNIAHLSDEEITRVQTAFLSKVYGWMLGALLVTAITAYYVIESGLYFSLSGYITYLFFAELGLVYFLVARIEKMSVNAAMLAFIVYSILSGVTLSVILLVYTSEAIYNTFFITAGMFGALSYYGYTTKKDLTGVGRFMFMGLVGIILAMVVNLFIGFEPLALTISIIGVFIFAGLTAYDTQKLKEMALVEMQGEEEATKGAIFGALGLYLNFINMFLFLLHIFGGDD